MESSHEQVYKRAWSLGTSAQNPVPPMAVCIINYNTREHLRACLLSIQAELPPELVVVDNASTDGSAEMAMSLDMPIAVSAKKTNVGYGAAANEAIATCTTKYVLLLNSDTLLEPGTLHALSTYLDTHPHVGVVGPRVVQQRGALQISCFAFPTPLQLFLSAYGLERFAHRIPWLRDFFSPIWPYTNGTPVDWVLGAALAIRREAFEAVGGFDESFFMYCEEIDLCYRLRAAAWETHFAPITTIVHAGGASTRQRRIEMSVQLYASLFHFYRQHYSSFRRLQLKFVLTLIMLRKIMASLIRLYTKHHRHTIIVAAMDLAAWSKVLLDSWKG